jgi:hypothetical protein
MVMYCVFLPAIQINDKAGKKRWKHFEDAGIEQVKSLLILLINADIFAHSKRYGATGFHLTACN